MHKPLVLIVEDDQAVRNLLATALEINGYHYLTAETGQICLRETVSYTPDIIILDLGLPDMDGIEIIKKIRTWSMVPIIVVTARNEDKDKIDCLDAGADDYLTKPFSVDELLARLRASLRRVRSYGGAENESASIFTNGELKIDYAAGCAFMAERELHLTPIEYKLLCLLAKNVGKVLTHNALLKEIWGSYTNDDTQNLRVFMATLRKKIDGTATGQSQYFQTHIRVGYRMLKV